MSDIDGGLQRFIVSFAICLVCIKAYNCPYYEDVEGNGVIDSFQTDLLNSRQTRAISLAVKGQVALKTLLKGACPAKTKARAYRKYEKPGNLETAIRDFYSIKPNNRKRMNIGIYMKSKPGEVLTGTAGDRRVVLLLEGDKWSNGHPVLEVIDVKSTSKPNIDRIVYKKFDF